MSHRWQTQLPGRRSPRRRQLLRPSGLCLGLLLQRRLEKREGWLPSFLCVADKRVCRSVHERSSSPSSLSLFLLGDDLMSDSWSVIHEDFWKDSEGGGLRGASLSTGRRSLCSEFPKK